LRQTFNIGVLAVNGHQGIFYLADGIGNGFGIGIQRFAPRVTTQF
jgi:hypothetical protein